ncbi:hypothetical protein [Enterococcus italicus]|uniref:hypothetical protein n=1 Tax=Enterococcus italicus TaxID=246144 RepID=UPI003F4671F5
MFATSDEIKQMVNDTDFSKFDDGRVQGYIERADIYITARTRCDYSKATDKALKNKLKIATGKTVRYLFMLDTSKILQKKMEGISSESTPDYSYSMSSTSLAISGGSTGDAELDLLLSTLTVGKSPIYFDVSGPTRAAKRRWRNGIR